MIFSFHKWFARGKFLLLFVLLTFLLYHAMLLVSRWIEPMDKYKQPSGKAVKVFGQHASISDPGSMFDRLKLFYWYGE